MAAKWSDTSFTDKSRGQVRFEQFKETYSDYTLTGPINGKITTRKVGEFETWPDVITTFNQKSRKNPDGTELELRDTNGNIVKFVGLPRPQGRQSGQKAEDMEMLVGITALTGVNNWADFKDSFTGWHKERTLKFIKERFPDANEKNINKIIDLVGADESYGETFISVGNNIRKILGNESRDKLRIMPKKEWDAIKDKVAKIASDEQGEKFKGDKWNPADLLIYKAGVEGILKDLDSLGSIVAINNTFNKYFYSKDVFPISVKQKAKAIKGSRSIQNQITSLKSSVNVRDIIKAGKLDGVPVMINYNPKTITDTTSNHTKILSWMHAVGKSFIEETAAVALGWISWSANFYIVNDEYIETVDEGTKQGRLASKLNLDRIVISFTSQAVWLRFSGIFLLIRYKSPSGIQMSADLERNDNDIDVNNFTDTIVQTIIDVKEKDLSTGVKNIVDNLLWNDTVSLSNIQTQPWFTKLSPAKQVIVKARLRSLEMLTESRLAESEEEEIRNEFEKLGLLEDYDSRIPADNFVYFEEPKMFGDLILHEGEYKDSDEIEAILESKVSKNNRFRR